MKQFILISCDPRVEASEMNTLRQRAETALQQLLPDAPIQQNHSSTTLHLCHPNQDVPVFESETQRLISQTRGLKFSNDKNRADPRTLLHALQHQDDATLARLTPPASAYGMVNDTCHAVTDALGLAHLYLFQCDHIAAIASSSLLIAKVFELQINELNVIQQSLIGHAIHDHSPIRDVRKLEAGHALVMQQGRIETRMYQDCVKMMAEVNPSDDSILVEQASSVLADITNEMIEAFAPCELELTGGIDSRLVLSSINPQQRHQVTAFTIGAEDAIDVVRAKEIADRLKLKHLVIDTTGLTRLSDDNLIELVRRGARQTDFSLNIVDRCLVEYVNMQHQPHARFSGIGGEIFSGFYYALQPLKRSPTNEMIENLIRWRVISNDRANTRLFAGTKFNEAIDAIISTLTNHFPKQKTWGNSLDTYYVLTRMQRWAGQGLSAVLDKRAVLIPMFDMRWLDQTRQIGSSWKQGANLHAALICKLDPQLAGMRLTGRPSPTHILNPRIRDRITTRLSTFQKAARKIRQQYRGTSKTSDALKATAATLGKSTVLKRLNIERLCDQGLFNADFIRSYVEDHTPKDRGTTSVLWLVDSLLEDLQ